MLLAAPDKTILYLSQTYEGSVHDKRIADEAGIAFDTAIELLQDSGFQGFRPNNAIIAQPVKKPRAIPIVGELFILSLSSKKEPLLAIV